MGFWKSFKEPLISLFILLNLATIVFMNVPARLAERVGKLLDSHELYGLAARARVTGIRLRQYAGLTGLDPHWEMFSTAKGDDWRYLIEGRCAQGMWKLPLPGQSERSFWQENLFDYKEGKLRCNIALDPVMRRAYGGYLCRKYTCPGGEAMKSVRINILYQKILTPQEARISGRHLGPVIRSEVMEDLACG